MNVNEINAKILALGTNSNVDIFRVGKSLFDRDILGVHIGNYFGNQVLLTGSICATDYVTSLLLIKMIDYLKDKQYNGGFYFVPLVNPDGVELVLNGAESIRCKKFRDYILDVNNGNSDFSMWQANANAVDLNENFNVLWGEGVQNVKCPQPSNFIGFYPESEREIQDLIKFVVKNQPSITIDYHMGENIVYYGFENQSKEESAKNLKIANNIASNNGYSVLKSEGMAGGFQEFSINELKIPSISIYVGNEDLKNSSDENINEIYEQNKEVPLIALSSINNIKKASIANGKRLWKGLCLRR
jgi:g-D-glutamyl-meso-diaminopimelate peptidase